MNRRAFLAALPPSFLGISSVAAAPAPDAESDRQVLRHLEDYLNSIRSLRARFEQTAPDGAVTRGTVWLERPGMVRFQYDPPTPLLLVATGGEVIFQDFQLHQTSRIALSRTPLGILLSDHVSFSDSGITVVQLLRLPTEVQVTVERSTDPGGGLLAIVFTTNPLTLWQWTIVDPQRKITRVRLHDLRINVPIDPTLFRPAVMPPR